MSLRGIILSIWADWPQIWPDQALEGVYVLAFGAFKPKCTVVLGPVSVNAQDIETFKAKCMRPVSTREGP